MTKYPIGTIFVKSGRNESYRLIGHSRLSDQIGLFKEVILQTHEEKGKQFSYGFNNFISYGWQPMPRKYNLLEEV
jgi:hypothetical protein